MGWFATVEVTAECAKCGVEFQTDCQFKPPAPRVSCPRVKNGAQVAYEDRTDIPPGFYEGLAERLCGECVTVFQLGGNIADWRVVVEPDYVVTAKSFPGYREL